MIDLWQRIVSDPRPANRLMVALQSHNRAISRAYPRDNRTTTRGFNDHARATVAVDRPRPMREIKRPAPHPDNRDPFGKYRDFLHEVFDAKDTHGEEGACKNANNAWLGARAAWLAQHEKRTAVRRPMGASGQ